MNSFVKPWNKEKGPVQLLLVININSPRTRGFIIAHGFLTDQLSGKYRGFHFLKGLFVSCEEYKFRRFLKTVALWLKNFKTGRRHICTFFF